jgi:2-succinyl-5-enolpyruvyl-6-hydroxy-3-cyclohexene-1-carboxylate synthase
MNRNTLWSEIFVDELARSGLKAVCAAPGSRHTPLMLAFAKHPDIKVYSHLDERSASFFALGLALASDAPVALICTSGTAGANMYPAIIEAHQSRVPLIVITADRPPELRHSGANQTIDQIKMFGDFVLWFVDMALPEANPPALAIRNLRTTANRAYTKANGIRKGVVHLNMPFRKPLEPIVVEGDMVEVPEEAKARSNEHSSVNIRTDNFRFVSTSLDALLNTIIEHRKGIIICGSGYLPYTQLSQIDPKYDVDIQRILASLSKSTGYPIIADGVSNLRLHPNSSNRIIGAYNNIPPSDLRNILESDVVIRFGNIPISASLSTVLENMRPEHYVLVSGSGEWSEDQHLVTDFFPAHEAAFANELVYHLGNTEPWAIKLGRENRDTNLEHFYEIEQSSWQTVDHEIKTGAYFDGAVVYDVVELIPAESTLFVGNSLPVRHLDQFGKPQNKYIYTYANRGASGIDGNISSALGAGAARPDKPLVAIFGDITFYHDMNGLLAVQRCGVPVTIVLLNNDGGGIFNRLPIKNFEPEFTDYFLTPHGLDFSHAAKMYGLDYVPIDAYEQDAREAFRQAFSTSVDSGKSTIIEVRTDSRKDEARRQEIVAAVHARLQELNL